MERDWDCVVLDGEPIVDYTNSYSAGYTAILQEIEQTRTCPFSRAGMEAQLKEIFAVAGSWFAMGCTPRYRDREKNEVPLHFLLVSKRHGLWVPTPDDMYCVGMLMETIREMHPDVEAWGMAMRLSNHGKSEFGGQSIRHNHLHFFAPNTGEDSRTLSGRHGVAVDFGFF